MGIYSDYYFKLSDDIIITDFIGFIEELDVYLDLVELDSPYCSEYDLVWEYRKWLSFNDDIIKIFNKYNNIIVFRNSDEFDEYITFKDGKIKVKHIYKD